MSGQYHRDHASSLAHERMRHALMAVACTMLAFPTAALAEVCDKVVGEHWRPGDGQARMVTFPDPDWKVSLNLGAIALGIPCLLALVALTGRISLLAAIVLKWVGYVVAELAVFVAFFAVHGMVFLEDIDAIHALAGKEGCIIFHHDWGAVAINAGVIALIVLVYAWMAFRLRRFERSVEARQRQLVAS
jgi:hypothetical protein